MFAQAFVTLDLTCVHLRIGSGELRVQPRADNEKHEFETELFQVGDRKVSDTWMSGTETALHEALTSWELAMNAVLPGLRDLPRMAALYLMHLHLRGESLEQAQARVRGALSTLPRTATWRDVARSLFLPAHRFEGGREAVARDVRQLCAAPPPALRTGRHVLVAAPGRSGTRWMLETASRLLTLHAPTLTIARHLVGEDRPGQGPAAVRCRWIDQIADCNLYFSPEDAPAVLAALAGIPPLRTVALVCPPSTLLVTKVVGSPSPRSWAATYPCARFVSIQRDPRNVALSRRFHHTGSMVPRLIDIWRGVALYSVDALLQRARARGGRRFMVRYEDMLSDLPGQLARLAHWLGLHPDPAGLELVARDLTFEAMSGRPCGEIQNGQYFRGGSDWTREFTLLELALAAGFDPLVERLGYPPARQSLWRRLRRDG